MVYAKTIKGNVLAVFLAVLMAFSVPFRAKADGGVTYTGYLYMAEVPNTCPLKGTFDDTNANNELKFANYEGDFLQSISFYQNEGYVYNGMATLRVTYKRTSSFPNTSKYGKMALKVSDIQNPDGITLGLSLYSVNADSYTINYTLQFSEYSATYTGAYYIPFNIGFSQTVYFGEGVTHAGLYLNYSTEPSVDWYGNLKQYENYEDSPGMDGTVIEQNNTIIVDQQEQNRLQEEQNNLQTQGNQLQQQGNHLQEEQNQLQEEQNRLQEEQNKQEKNFFDNFFDNLGSTVRSWFIPTSEELTAFLDEVNGWFGDRLGFVWYPFDLAYDMVSALAQGEANPKLKVPEFTLDILGTRYTIWKAIEVDLDVFGIFKYVRFFTSVMVVGGTIRLAINKWDSWIGGRNG